MSDAVLQVADIGTPRSGSRLCWIARTATQRWQAEALTETAGTVMAIDECNGIPSRNDLSAAGAYVLAITIAAPIAVKLAGKLVGVLNAGNYLYCGSARGPGGLRARLSRHIRRDKSIRWHVDQLTTQGFVKGVWTFPGGDECKLVKRLSFLQTSIQGFGSSDCRQCDSHLLDWPNWLSQGDLDRALASKMADLQFLRQSLL